VDVKGINNNYVNPNLVNAYNKKKSVPSEVTSKSGKINDKLELSSEAKKLKGTEMDKAKLSEVKEKINNGFYNSEAVLNKVADKIYKEIAG